MPARVQRILANLCLSLLALVFCFALLEIAARVYLTQMAGEERFLRCASIDQLRARYPGGNFPGLAHAPNRYLGYAPAPHYASHQNRHNALGFRGGDIQMPKPSGEFRIACIGGSTTYCTYIDNPAQAYPAVMERILREHGHNVTVINAGVQGYASYESLINLSFRVLDTEPDLIVFYEGANDLFARFVWPHDAYRGDNSGYRAPTLPLLTMAPIWEHSTLIRSLLLRARLIEPQSLLFRAYDTYAPTFWGYIWRNQIEKGSYPSGVFEQTSAQQMLAQNPPVYFQRNLESMIGICKAHGIQAVLATFTHAPSFTQEPWASSPEIQPAFEEMNSLIRQVAAGSGVPLYDFANGFTPTPSWFYDGIHLNETGAEEQGKKFAAFIEPLLPPK